jgi:hypothetical protein
MNGVESVESNARAAITAESITAVGAAPGTTGSTGSAAATESIPSGTGYASVSGLICTKTAESKTTRAARTAGAAKTAKTAGTAERVTAIPTDGVSRIQDANAFDRGSGKTNSGIGSSAKGRTTIGRFTVAARAAIFAWTTEGCPAISAGKKTGRTIIIQARSSIGPRRAIETEAAVQTEIVGAISAD